MASASPHAIDDPMCRKLSASEQQWLAQSSLICLAGCLSPAMSASLAAAGNAPARLRAVVDGIRAIQPFLNVNIDTGSLCFRRNAEILVTGETVKVDGGGGIAALRAAAARQLSAGIDREVCLARCHLVEVSSTSSMMLLVIADHLCFDGRSLVVMFESICRSIAQEGEAGGHGPMLDFVDWTERIPAGITFPEPFRSPVETIRLKVRDDASPPEALADSVVEDHVVLVPADTMLALKEQANAKGATLNAPLMAAFLAAAADTAAARDPQGVPPPPYNVRSVCAVDLREALGLPNPYMNNSSSVVPVHGVFPSPADAASLWSTALASQQVLQGNIEANEAFRLHDITEGARFAELGPYFDILCLWSNLGLIRADGVDHVEVHLRGAGSNPIVSGHPITCSHSGTMSLTLTFAPGMHERGTVVDMGDRFLANVALLATSD